MNTKKLKPNPIIPPALYVTRAADRQVRRIVDDMGRPGYVLVARQMGKTNLLLNAKRQLESDNDCFLYLDVSNPFPNILSFFRNIVDTALDTYSERLGNVSDAIQRRRTNTALPHKEHELELRDILRAIPGKMIVCLDEIDALTKTSYSDNVFSFIRSIYFSGRTNFPEFSRLTYILSGVAEPTSLIKNRDVSPFNIGEKILLDDFSADEFKSFIEKAGVDFAPVVQDRIFFWMRGNPRMTWDICSKLEDLHNENISLNASTVDDTVKKFYLTNFDVPPIDHLRTLAEDDKEIRQAIMSIHYGKASSISDAVKAKLYLHGFVQVLDDINPVYLKNKVIEEALSENWLQDVEQRKTSLIERADYKMKEGLFNEALSLYEQYARSSTSPQELNLVYYSMGRCCIEISKFLDALNYFEKVNFDKGELPIRFLATHYHSALCFRRLGRLDEALNRLTTVIEEGNRLNIRNYHFDAKILLSNIYLALNRDADVVEVTRYVIESEDEIRKLAAEPRIADELLMAAHFNASLAAETKISPEAAMAHLVEALGLSADESKVGIYIQLVKLETSKAARREYVFSCVRHVIEKRLPIIGLRSERPLDFHTDNFIQLLLYVVSEEDTEGFDLLVHHLLSGEIKHYAPPDDVIYAVVLGVIACSDKEIAVRLIDHTVNVNQPKPGSPKRRSLLTLGLILRTFDPVGKIEKLYFEEFLDRDSSHLIESDYRLCFGLVRGYLDAGMVEKARDVFTRFSELRVNNETFKTPGSETIMSYLRVLVGVSTDFNESVASEARNLVAQITGANVLHPPLYFAESVFKDIKNLLMQLLTEGEATTFRRTGKKIGRNERVKVKFKDGKTVTDKYKRLEHRINSGECELVE